MKQNTCLNCGTTIKQGERFCSSKCRQKYDNTKGNKLALSECNLPQAVVDDIEIYAEAEGLSFKEALYDLLLCAIKVRLPQLNLKPISPKISPAKSVHEKEMEGVDIDIDLDEL